MIAEGIEGVPSARQHERHCVIDANGVATIRVTLHEIRPGTTSDVVLATITQPFGRYDYSRRAESPDGQWFTVLTDPSDRTVRFVLQDLVHPVATLTWWFKVSSALPFLKADEFLPPEDYWQRGGRRQLLRSYVLRIHCEQLKFVIEFEDDTLSTNEQSVPVFAAPRARVEWERSYRDGRSSRWEPDQKVAAELTEEVPGRKVSMLIRNPSVGRRYGIVLTPLLGAQSSDYRVPLRLGNMVRNACRRERRRDDPLSRELEERLLERLPQALELNPSDISDFGQATATVFLWNREKHVLQATYGCFPYEHYRVEFRFGCGVAGHAFRFGRPAAHHKENAADTPMIYEERGHDPQDWVICLPLKGGPHGAPIGVVSISGAAQAANALELELAAIARDPRTPEAEARIKVLYWMVNMAFWGVLKHQLKLDNAESKVVDEICGRFAAKPDLVPGAAPPPARPEPASRPQDQAPRIERLVGVAVPQVRQSGPTEIPSSSAAQQTTQSSNSLNPPANSLPSPPRRDRRFLKRIILAALSSGGIGAVFLSGTFDTIKLHLTSGSAATDGTMTTDQVVQDLRSGARGVARINQRQREREQLPSLKEADLSGVDLTKANLSNADLRSANLRQTVLCHAKLTAAYLADADLRDADLSGVDLVDAKLIRANLSQTSMRDADLRNADLTGAIGLLQAQLDQACGSSTTRLDGPLHVRDCP